MVVAKIEGGLGNQMFIYAAAKALSIKNKHQLKLDIHPYQERYRNKGITNRQYELSVFNQIKDELIITDKFKKLIDTSLFNKLRQKILGLNYYFEKNYVYSPGFWHQNSKTIYLDGYFQDERYFNEYKKEIQKSFSLNSIELDSNGQGLLNQIIDSNSVAIHVRRGDYVNNQEIAKIHGVCSLEYYSKAINYINSKVENPHFFLFSDDTTWLKENFSFEINKTICEGSNNGAPIGDMKLISTCKHQIIANSSFSWWAAWLNQFENKIVVAPNRWFADNAKNELHKNLVPSSWVRL